MQEEARRAQLSLPAALDRGTRRPITLEQAIGDPDSVADPASLSDEERVTLVKARWEAGEWTDVYYGARFVDLTRAIEELESGTDVGRGLLLISERAAQMAHEDLGGPLGGERGAVE